MQNKPPQAIAYYKQAVDLDGDNLNAYWYLAGYYRQSGHDDSAIAAYYALARLSETYMIWHELGALLGKNGRYREAIDAFRTSIELNAEKNNISAFLGLAAAYDAIDSVEWGEQTLSQAVRLDSSDVRVYRQQLTFYMDRQNIQGAIRAAEKLVDLTPSDWVAQRRLGILLYSDNQLDRADSLFRSRVEFGDDNVLNFFYIGRMAAERQDYTEAKERFSQVTVKEPEFIDGWLNLGYVYRQMDSLEAAVGSFSQGLNHTKARDERTRLLFALGSAYERQGRFEDAVNSFNEIIVLDSIHAPSLNYLGYMLADRGVQLQYALELLERALALSPDNGAYVDSYAWVQYRLGKLDVALAELKKAAGLLQDDPTIYEHLGDVYRALGNEQEAVQNYRRSLEIDPKNKAVEEKLK
jgi:tetratricopeptide (TPR) repeat protein